MSSNISLEAENRSLQLRQTRTINEKLKKIRTITKKSLSDIPPLEGSDRGDMDTIPSPASAPSPIEFFQERKSLPYHETPNIIDDTGALDDTGSFTIPETPVTPRVASKILESLNRVTEEKLVFMASRKLLRRWRIL